MTSLTAQAGAATDFSTSLPCMPSVRRKDVSLCPSAEVIPGGHISSVPCTSDSASGQGYVSEMRYLLSIQVIRSLDCSPSSVPWKIEELGAVSEKSATIF